MHGVPVENNQDDSRYDRFSYPTCGVYSVLTTQRGLCGFESQVARRLIIETLGSQIKRMNVAEPFIGCSKRPRLGSLGHLEPPSQYS